MTETGKKMQRNISIILIGAIISMALSAMYISGSTSFDAFYDVGNVFDCGGHSFYYGVGAAYNYDSGKMEVIEEKAYQEWNFPYGLGDYNYFVIELSDLSRESLPVVVQFYKNDVNVHTVVTHFQNGRNVVEIARKDANNIHIQMKSQQGTSYDIESVQCREKLQVWNSYKFFGALVLVFFVYLIIVYFVRKVLRKRNISVFQYKILEKLQKIYGKVEEKLIDTWKFPKQEKASVLRKILFFLMIFIVNYEEKAGISVKKYIWSRNVWIYCIILIAIAVLSIEKGHRRRNWKNPLVYSWFLLSVCMVVSNFIVEKHFKNVGIIFLLVFGFLFYVWGNMADKTKLLQDFCTAVKWEFWIDVGYCFLFYPESPGIRYCGSFLNSNIYAIYVMVPWTVFLAELVEIKGTQRKALEKNLSALGLGIASCMIWKTQCRTTLLGMVMVLGVVLLICKRERILKRKKERRVLLYLLLVVILGCYVGKLGITVLPKVQKETQTETSAENIQQDRNNIFVMQVRAADNTENFMQRFSKGRTLDEFTSGRIIYWKAYLRQMNLWGHELRATVNGMELAAHNGFLSIAYEYGVLSAIPYLFWIFYYVWYAFGYLKREWKEKKYAAFPVFLILAMVPVILFENLEQPFRWEAWVAMYLTAGILFEKDTEAEQVN